MPTTTRKTKNKSEVKSGTSSRSPEASSASSSRRESKRLSQACLRCQRRKIKCDDLVDGCAHCKKANKPCEYTLPNSNQIATRHETTDLAAKVSARDHEIEVLRGLVQQYERNHAALQGKQSVEQAEYMQSKRIKVRTPPPANDLPQGATYYGIRLLDTSGQVQLSTIEGSRMTLFDRQFDLSACFPPRHSKHSQIFDVTEAEYFEQIVRSYPGIWPDLPPRDEAEAQAMQFFTQTSFFTPIVHLPDFMELLDYALDAPTELSANDMVIVQMVFAVHQYQCAIRGGEPAAALGQQAKERLLWSLRHFERLRQDRSLQAFQALTLISMAMRALQRPGASWHCIDRVMSYAISNDFHIMVDQEDDGHMHDEESLDERVGRLDIASSEQSCEVVSSPVIVAAKHPALPSIASVLAMPETAYGPLNPISAPEARRPSSRATSSRAPTPPPEDVASSPESVDIQELDKQRAVAKEMSPPHDEDLSTKPASSHQEIDEQRAVAEEPAPLPEERLYQPKAPRPQRVLPRLDKKTQHNQMRQRVFWSLLVFHVHVCCNLGRPFRVNPSSIKIEIPKPTADMFDPADGETMLCSWENAPHGFRMIHIMIEAYIASSRMLPSSEYVASDTSTLLVDLDNMRYELPVQDEMPPASALDFVGRVAQEYLKLAIHGTRLYIIHMRHAYSYESDLSEDELDALLHECQAILHVAQTLHIYSSIDTTVYYNMYFVYAFFMTLWVEAYRAERNRVQNKEELKRNRQEWMLAMKNVSRYLGMGSELSWELASVVSHCRRRHDSGPHSPRLEKLACRPPSLRSRKSSSEPSGSVVEAS